MLDVLLAAAGQVVVELLVVVVEVVAVPAGRRGTVAAAAVVEQEEPVVRGAGLGDLAVPQLAGVGRVLWTDEEKIDPSFGKATRPNF